MLVLVSLDVGVSCEAIDVLGLGQVSFVRVSFLDMLGELALPKLNVLIVE